MSPNSCFTRDRNVRRMDDRLQPIGARAAVYLASAMQSPSLDGFAVQARERYRPCEPTGLQRKKKPAFTGLTGRGLTLCVAASRRAFSGALALSPNAHWDKVLLLVGRQLLPKAHADLLVCEIDTHAEINNTGVVAGADEIEAAGIERQAPDRAVNKSVAKSSACPLYHLSSRRSSKSTTRVTSPPYSRRPCFLPGPWSRQ
jgi:hypothetical protein